MRRSISLALMSNSFKSAWSKRVPSEIHKNPCELLLSRTSMPQSKTEARQNTNYQYRKRCVHQLPFAFFDCFIYGNHYLKWICLLASPTANATAFARLKLRANGEIGIVKWFSKRAKTSGLRPTLSLPKTSQSPSWNSGS
jgi:hypothetical protein